MSTARKEFNDQIADNNKRIAELQAENLELLKAALMTSDETQWYTEKEEPWIAGRGKDRKKTTAIIGRVNWISKYKDEDTGKMVEVPRSRIVKVNGQWDL